MTPTSGSEDLPVVRPHPTGALRLLQQARTVARGRADEGGDGMRQDIEFDG
jgi:hypothetical protein